jgi:hypothetical protein
VSGVVPLTREVVALGSRYMVVAVVWGMVDTGTTLAALSGSSQSGGREELLQQQLWDIFSLTSNNTNKNMRTAEDTRTRVMLSRLRGGPEGKAGELEKMSPPSPPPSF